MLKDPGKRQANARNLARVKKEINQPRLAMSVRRALKGNSAADLPHAKPVFVKQRMKEAPENNRTLTGQG